MNQKVSKDLNGNKKILYKKEFCEVCKKKTEFVNVGSADEEWVCTDCQSKTDFGKHVLVINQFGFYWKEKI